MEGDHIEDLFKNVHMPKANKSAFITYGGNPQLSDPEIFTQTLVVTGEKGYRTAVSSHGLTDGCYYFEIEWLSPMTPLPFVGVEPAIRLGFTSMSDPS